MTYIEDQDIEALIARSEEIETHDYRNSDDDDDHVSMRLYKTPEGQHFRYIETSGMNSTWAGALEVAEWIPDASIANWSEGN